MQQIEYEKELANLLKGVDIIVAGGSDTRMGDSNDQLFSNDLVTDKAFAEHYPYETTDADGNPVIVVKVDAEFTTVAAPPNHAASVYLTLYLLESVLNAPFSDVSLV